MKENQWKTKEKLWKTRKKWGNRAHDQKKIKFPKQEKKNPQKIPHPYLIRGGSCNLKLNIGG